MAHPFRFGVQIGDLPADRWQEQVRTLESQGYASVFLPDHFGTQWEPATALAGIAAATETLKVGSLVYDVDYRHSRMTAEQVADCPLFLTRSASEIRETLEKRRAETGISYIVIQGGDPGVLENFAKEVVQPLSGC